MPHRMLVLEIAIPEFDVEDALDILGEEPSAQALREYLGLVSSDAMITFRSMDDEPCEGCGERHDQLAAYGGDIVRVRINETDWIMATADSPQHDTES
jgi:hypothetical protein